ncbi:MAG: hypothetical protein NW215_10200 [Hyphomicrobiales bacterium]|nr:hypothetical protein [Hyphomicrobiales bacterium]
MTPKPKAFPETPYRRHVQLPKLLPLWPEELDDETPEGAAKIVGKLRRALIAERRRGRSRAWSYDINRHMALLDALEAETAALKARVRTRLTAPPSPR